MSQETLEHLNTNTLIGFTDKRGHAWHYRREDQGEESNHYSGAVPIEDVRRRLFPWSAVEGVLTATFTPAEGSDQRLLTTVDDARKAIMRSDNGAILGIFRQGYSIHQFDDWLLKELGIILDDDLAIGSAGLLKGGAVAWVSVEVPDNIEGPAGVVFRPNLLACTSHDGSLATTYQRCVTNVVCDNTMSAALSEGRGGNQRVKIKHSRYSNMRLQDARDALAIVHTIADDFMAQVERLTSVRVSPQDWMNFMDALVPVPEDEGRGRTRAENKRAALNKMYEHDDRCAPWKGTAWGVVQACNTFAHHESTVKGGNRADRNMLRAARGECDTLDIGTLEILNGLGMPVLA